MKTTAPAELLIINSRHNLFWFELVLVVNNTVVKNYGQFRTSEEAEKTRKTILKK